MNNINKTGKMDVTEKVMPMPKAGETAEQYHGRLVAAGFAGNNAGSHEGSKSPSSENTVLPSTESLDRLRLQALEDQLTSAVPETGSIGNKSLREKLAMVDPVWATDTYWAIKQRCIDNGLLLPGRGRGGSVLRAKQFEQPEVEASWSSPAVAEASDSKRKPKKETKVSTKAVAGQTEKAASSNEEIRLAFETGVKAFNEGDYATTLREWGRLADQGIPIAQYNIGLMLYSGRGVAKDVAKAFSWLEKASAGGHVRAQLKTGQMLEQGTEVSPDLAAAATWYRKAAESGNAQAQYLLAKMYLTGRGVGEDEAQALAWFRKAAEQNHLAATYELAMLYGRHPFADDEEWKKWMSQAAEQRHAGAQFLLYSGFNRGLHGLRKNREVALKWLQDAAKGGDISAQFSLGCAYSSDDEEESLGLKEDHLEAARWFRLAANRGDLNSQEALEGLYVPGDLLPKSPKKAFAWLADAADDGDCVAQYMVGERLMKGEGVAKDISEAARWFEASADQGYPWAQLTLGTLYAEGQGVNQDIEAASQWYMAAVEQKKPDDVDPDIQEDVRAQAALLLVDVNEKLGRPSSAELLEYAENQASSEFYYEDDDD